LVNTKHSSSIGKSRTHVVIHACAIVIGEGTKVHLSPNGLSHILSGTTSLGEEGSILNGTISGIVNKFEI